MNRQILENVLFVVGVILYNIFFWDEQMGLNTLLFTIFIIGSSFYLNPESRHSTIARLTALGTLFTAVMVVVFNSQFSKVVHWLSLMAMVGFIQQRELRFLWYALLLMLQSIFSVPIQAFRKLKNTKFGNRKHLRKFSRYFKLAIIPMFIVGIFFTFYVISNQAFGEMAEQNIGNFLNWIFGFEWYLSPPRVMFFIFSVFVMGGILWQTKSEWLLRFQKMHKETIIRKRKTLSKNPLIVKNSFPNESGRSLSNVNDDHRPFRSKSMIALKNEYRSGLIMLVSLNVLTLLVNITDIQNIWFGFANTKASSLWQDVHYGTYVLIFTIFMAMGVLVYFFRKNLNFYQKNKWLKITAIAWMVQNMFLALSVALRNIKYINYYGLTYKRIGVFIFLALVIYGLGTMIYKVNHKKTAYYLFQHNAWSMYIVLILLTSVNWDILITNYNLNLKSEAKPDKLYIAKKLSDKNLPILYKNSELFTGELVIRPYSFENMLEQKRVNFIVRKNSQSWLSWNLADHNTLLYLKKHKKQHLAD